MNKISDAVSVIIDEHSGLSFGFYNGLFNLTKLAKWILPHVASMTKKDVTTSSITMALSRQSQIQKQTPIKADFFLSHISIISSLCIISIHKNEDAYDRVAYLHKQASKDKKYFITSESTGELTMIFDTSLSVDVNQSFADNLIKDTRSDVNALSIGYPPAFAEQPGVLSMIFETLSIRGINILEISSTFTEVIIYVSESELREAFDSLYQVYKQK